MASQSPLKAPDHVLQLLARLHKQSLDQEAAISKDGKVFSATVIGDLEDQMKGTQEDARSQFDHMMLDKFIALDEDKCHFMYQLLLSIGATNVVEAGTSFGVSTIYLALAVGENKKRTGKSGTVIATEKEAQKAEIAKQYWAECGADVTDHIDLRVGDLLETLKDDLPDEVDLLLLDSMRTHCHPRNNTPLTLWQYGPLLLSQP
jgi:predicted O-methyltransferase YrrM